MQDTPCAIHADYVGIKTLSGRKVVQITCEVALERLEEVIGLLGSPNPSTGKPVGIALLHDFEVDVKREIAERAVKEKRAFTDFPLSQQAAMLCKDERFHGELRVLSGDKSRLVYAVASLDQDKHDTYASDCIHADHNLKKILGISSKTELDDPDNKTKRDKFIQLRSELLSKTRSYPEQRG